MLTRGLPTRPQCRCSQPIPSLACFLVRGLAPICHQRELMLKGVVHSQSHSSGTSALPDVSHRLQTAAGHRQGGWRRGDRLFHGPWGLSGFQQLTSSQTAAAPGPACELPCFSTPHTIRSVFPQCFLHGSDPCSLLPPSTVQRVQFTSIPYTQTHKHTRTQRLQNTHSHALLPQYPPTCVLTHVCSC